MVSRIAVAASPFGAPDLPSPPFASLEGYEIQGVLARSSFAVLYRGYDPALKTHVAIKEYLPEAFARHDADAQVVLRDPGHAEAFDRGLLAFVGEAELLARCEHPSLLHVLRVLRCRGTAYRVMRYHPGPTLLEFRQQQATPIASATLRDWLDDLLDALHIVHEQGCVHGAVAPGNILVQADLRPLLLDLDAVRGALVSDRTQDLMATLEACFEPLEQRAASYLVAGPWTDLYSLAATLHFCISGQLPSPLRATRVPGHFEPLPAVWQRLRDAHPELGAEPAWLRALDTWLSDDPQQRPLNVAEAKAMLDAPPATMHDLPAEVAPDPLVEMAPPVDVVPDRAGGGAADPPQAPPWADLLPRATSQRRRLWTIGAVALLVMTTVVAITTKPDGRADDAAQPAPAQGAQASPMAQVTRASHVAQATQAARMPQSVLAESSEERAAEPSLGPDVFPVIEPTGPVAAQAIAATAAPAPAASAPLQEASAPSNGRDVRVTSSPRQRCGSRSGYELLRCMKAQCAKRTWTKHEQCRRLRQNWLS